MIKIGYALLFSITVLLFGSPRSEASNPRESLGSVFCYPNPGSTNHKR